MGRLPDLYQGRKIMSRLPYVMAASVNMTSSQTGIQFPSASFLHNNDKPFEIHRMLPTVLSVLASNPTQVTGVSDMRYVSCRILDFGKNQELTKASTPLASLIKSQTERVWEWSEPHYLKKTEGFTTTLDTSVFTDTETIFRVQIAFQGYLITIPPER